MTPRLTDLEVTARELGPRSPAELRAHYAAVRARINQRSSVVDTCLPPVPKPVVTVLSDLRPGDVVLPSGVLDERAPSARRIVATAALVFQVEQAHLTSPLMVEHLGPARRVTAHVGVRVCGHPPAELGRRMGLRTGALMELWARHVEDRVLEGDGFLAQMVADLRTALGV